MRFYDKINAECAHLIEPDVLVMSLEGASKLIDELSEEFEAEVTMDNIFSYMGMEVVISLHLSDDYRMARFIDTDNF